MTIKLPLQRYTHNSPLTTDSSYCDPCQVAELEAAYSALMIDHTILQTSNAVARRTGEYWKAEHLAANARIKELEAERDGLRTDLAQLRMAATKD